MEYGLDDKRGQEKLADAERIAKADLTFPDRKYDCIAIDPPWTYSLREGDKSHRNRTPYANMTLADIGDLPVRDLAAKGSTLFLWVTKDYMESGFELLKRWGFPHKQTITWVKMTKSGDRVRFGTGHWLRNAAEWCLVGVDPGAKSFSSRGVADTSNVILAPREEHSKKPEQFYAVAERLGERRIDLFARQKRAGWDCWPDLLG